MKLYSAKVRLSASLENEVVRHRLTPAEMKVLEFVHAGKHAVLVDVKETGSVKRTDRTERNRLAELYTRGDLTSHALIQKIFGVEGVPLPQVYEPPMTEAVEVYDDVEEDEEEEMIVRSDLPDIETMTA